MFLTVFLLKFKHHLSISPPTSVVQGLKMPVIISNKESIAVKSARGKYE